MARAASAATAPRSAMQTSCRPGMTSGVGCPAVKSKVSCGCAMLGAGLNPTLRTISFPLARPPFIPPSLLVAVVP